MKKLGTCLAAMILAAVLPGAVALSAEGPVEKLGQELVKTVAEGCQQEINTYCNEVTPGQNRILACLYAYNDKLSGKCEFALYDAASQLERAVAELTYVADECEDDLDQFCSAVKAGEGRLLACLHKNQKQVSERCNQALKDTSLK